MPLHKGASEKTIGRNIREMRAAGHPEKQAVAAAMREADESRGKRYGDMDVSKAREKKYDKKSDMFGDMDVDNAGERDTRQEEVEEGEHHSAMETMGKAAMAAHKSGDGHAFAKAIHDIMDLRKEESNKGEDDPAEKFGESRGGMFG